MGATGGLPASAKRLEIVSDKQDFDPNVHRKRLHHYDIPGHAHELTFSCYQRRPLLSEGSYCKILAEAIDRACAGHNYQLVAFVFMPEHVHLIVWPLEDASKIEELLFAIKRPSSFRIKQEMKITCPSLIDELTIRERPARSAFRLWQEGGGYDRNIHNATALRSSIEYLHCNPIRRALCSDPAEWQWSSYRYYSNPEAILKDARPSVHGIPIGC